MPTTIKQMIDGIPSLGSHAGMLNEIESVLDDPQSTLANVGEVIEKDPDLTARLLKLGNSSFFGFSSRIETVSETISLIGIQQVQDLISVSVVVEIFDGVPADLVNMESFWRHSLACGIAARQLAMARRVPKPEKFFVGGLLHDVGRMVLYGRAPEEARKIFALYQQGAAMLMEAERQTMGFDHTEIGEALLKEWNYPVNLVNMVRFHHSPMVAGSFQLEASIIHLADIMVNSMRLGSSGERRTPPPNARAWDRLGLGLDVLEQVVETVDSQITVVEQAFLKAPAHA